MYIYLLLAVLLIAVDWSQSATDSWNYSNSGNYFKNNFISNCIPIVNLNLIFKNQLDGLPLIRVVVVVLSRQLIFKKPSWSIQAN